MPATQPAPPDRASAGIAAGFANVRPVAAAHPVCCVLVDAEEDFDWLRPVRGVPYDVACMHHLSDLQGILAAYAAVPTYLLTYPVLQDAGVVAALRGRLARGQCHVGIQLHPWVTPPFSEPADASNSFAGNLPPGLEERKLLELMRRFRACFGEDAAIFRAGRYGLGRHTPALLEKHGFAIDTSIAPLTSFAEESGPDFSASDYGTFWFGHRRQLLEVPLCRSIAGWGGAAATRAYHALAAAEGPPPGRGLIRQNLRGLLAWTRCAERITLSPEGNDVTAAARLVHSLLGRGRNVLALSMHSSSLSVGRNPYVRSKADLHRFYDQISAIMTLLADRFAVRFVPALALPALLADA
jgi:hypothetical protein